MDSGGVKDDGQKEPGKGRRWKELGGRGKEMDGGKQK